MKENYVKNIGMSAMFIALGMVLPFFTGQIREIGNMLLPMHFPVFICCFVCGWKYGMTVGLILPLLRSIVFGMPMLYPVAIAMAVELGTYGLVAGMIYGLAKKKNLKIVYIALFSAMICGRIAWGIAQAALLGIGGTTFTWQMFITGALINAIPGIILQFILIPIIMSRIQMVK